MASGAVHFTGICFLPGDALYTSSSLDMPKSEIFTTLSDVSRQFLAARSLQIKETAITDETLITGYI